MPPKLFFVEGRPGALYFENVTAAASASDYAWDVSGVAVGAQLEDRWSYTPAAAFGPAPMAVASYSEASGQLVVQATTSITAAAATAGAGTAPSCLFIGDSLTNAGTYTSDLLAIASVDAMKLTLLGTRGSGANLHEGRPGWTVAHYTADFTDATGPNPFWIGGHVDFPAYLAANAIPTPDWVFILLGTNDEFSATSDAQAIATAQAAFTNLDTLIASVQAAGPAVRIGLMTAPPPNASQDAFGADYGSGQTRWRFKRNILLWDRELIAKYTSAAGIFIVPTHVNIDTVHNMQNGVHPAAAGYGQLAETVWAFLKST